MWIARAGMSTVTKQCPHCLGSRIVTVLFGDGEKATFDCGLCARGYEGSFGVIEDYEYIASADQRTVGGVESEQSPKGIKYRYRYNVRDGCYNISDGSEVFATQEEALKRSSELAAIHHKAHADCLEWKKEDTKRTWAWNASYHRRNIKEAQRQLEYHTKKLAVASAKSKEDKTV